MSFHHYTKNILLTVLLSIIFWSSSEQARAQWTGNWWRFDAKPFSQRTTGQKTATIVVGTLLAGAGIMLIDYGYTAYVYLATSESALNTSGNNKRSGRPSHPLRNRVQTRQCALQKRTMVYG